MRKNVLKLAALSLCLIAVSTVSAQSEEVSKKGKMKKFMKMDTNNDQKLSLTEYQAFRAEARDKKEKAPKKGNFTKRFGQIDANNDGFIDKPEFKNRKATKVKKEKKEKKA